MGCEHFDGEHDEEEEDNDEDDVEDEDKDDDADDKDADDGSGLGQGYVGREHVLMWKIMEMGLKRRRRMMMG